MLPAGAGPIHPLYHLRFFYYRRHFSAAASNSAFDFWWSKKPVTQCDRPVFSKAATDGDTVIRWKASLELVDKSQKSSTE